MRPKLRSRRSGIGPAGLKSRGTMTKAAVREDVARIIEIYHRNSRYQVEVTPNTIARGEGRVDLVFEIREGAKTGVKRIAFFGNREFAESRLKGVIKTTESGWFGFLKSSDVYDADRIEADADLLRRFYVKNGFADAHVSAAAAYDPAHQGFTLTFAIDEGARYRLGTIEIDSRIVALDGSSLRNVVHLAQGDIFDGEAVGKTADAITVAAGKHGFPFVDVRPHANRDSAANIINVVFTLDDGRTPSVRSSIGSSLIWDSPFGALRVDYAYPISKASIDVAQRLHFGVGAF